MTETTPQWEPWALLGLFLLSLLFAFAHGGLAAALLSGISGMALGIVLGIGFFKRWGDPKLMRSANHG